MPKRSAGLIMYRRRNTGLEVFLVHPGGPFWAKKDQGAWSIPKGEFNDDEAALDAAVREFQEETGFNAAGPFLEMGTIQQAGGKVVSAWAFEGDCDPAQLVSNICRIEWPPRSGRQLEFPEADRGRWFPLSEAELNILKSQQALSKRLSTALTQEGQ